MLQVYLDSNTYSSVLYMYKGESFVSRLYENKVHCYIATRPEVEGFIEIRVLCYQGLEFRGFVKKALPSREEPDISLSIYSE